MPEARRWLIGGRVQGVGFRPFVHRTALRHRLSGWVGNLVGRVEVIAAGDADALAAFGTALLAEPLGFAAPRLLADEPVPAPDCDGFRILPSRAEAHGELQLPPDQAVCDACLAELRDPADRRYRYPFISCTQCGPRYTLIRTLPYDRPNTTQVLFPLCAACLGEYEDPSDRRFHAETTACPECGPRLECAGAVGEAALQVALAALREGRIVAVKGIGGYHLMCDARDEGAVQRLRARKRRPHKPLAVMLASHPALEADPVRPIVLLPRATVGEVADAVAPGLREVGAMLPYTPLHHLLLDGFGGPLVATSANISGEPVIIDNADAVARLFGVADVFLHHDRPIARPADDPVLRPIAGRWRPMRLGRGTAPLELSLPLPLPRPVLALGGQGKNTVALGWGRRAVVSPHLGDMDTPRSQALLRQVAAELQALHGVRAELIACDAHPGYATTHLAREMGLPVERVFHHRAHAAALAAEHGPGQGWLLFAWDGAGYGEDGTIWGGEALLGRAGDWRRVATLRGFALPGGERAAREPWRSALGAVWEAGLGWESAGRATRLLRHAWERGLNCPRTSSAGRLFDAAAALLGVVDVASHEGHAPMLLEAACAPRGEVMALPSRRVPGATDGRVKPGHDGREHVMAGPVPAIRPGPLLGLLVADWAPLLARLIGMPQAEGAGLFHATLAGVVRDQAVALREAHGAFRVGLTGGVFQNRVLAEHALDLLQEAGFDACLPAVLPCNDAAISFGQLVEVACR